MIRTCLEAQLDHPSKGDWITTVQENLQELKIDMDLERIAGLGKEDFKNIIKKSVNQLSFDYLQKLRETHSKAKDLNYQSLQIQPYLTAVSDASLTIDEKKFLFALRCRMIEVKSNYKFGQEDLLCRACNEKEERQEHLLVCSALNENELVDDTPNYKDIFGSKLEKMIMTSRILRKKYKLLTTVNTRNGSSATKV